MIVARDPDRGHGRAEATDRDEATVVDAEAQYLHLNHEDLQEDELNQRSANTRVEIKTGNQGVVETLTLIDMLR